METGQRRARQTTPTGAALSDETRADVSAAYLVSVHVSRPCSSSPHKDLKQDTVRHAYEQKNLQSQIPKS